MYIDEDFCNKLINLMQLNFRRLLIDTAHMKKKKEKRLCPRDTLIFLNTYKSYIAFVDFRWVFFLSFWWVSVKTVTYFLFLFLFFYFFIFFYFFFFFFFLFFIFFFFFFLLLLLFSIFFPTHCNLNGHHQRTSSKCLFNTHILNLFSFL